MQATERVIAAAQADGRVRTIREWRLDVYCEGIAEFAARLGVPTSTLYRWEVGEMTPTISSQRRVADALGVDFHRVRWLDAPVAAALPEPPADAPRRTIREWRATFGETQPAFAARIGMSPQVVAAWEQGRKSPPRNSRYRVAKMLGLHPAQILWDDAPSAR
jgi:DNA-binding transcriptional regulator YiaG